MVVLHVAVGGTHVDDTGEAAAVAGGEAALVEVDVFHDVGVERREESERVVDLVERCAVEQEEVLVVVASVDIQSADEFHALSNTAGAL